MTRPTSASPVVSDAIGIAVTGVGSFRLTASGGCTLSSPQRSRSRMSAGNAAERRAYGHADPGRVALAEHVACHDFARGKEIRARLSRETHGCRFVDLDPKV